MVGNLSPEPPANFQEEPISSRSSTDFIVQDSDEESTVEENVYQLLSQVENDVDSPFDLEGTLPADENEENSIQEHPSSSSSESAPNTNSVSSSDVEQQDRLETRETLALYNSTHSDIQIDENQIRAVMSNIILPSSSYPAWARSIPEAQLGSLLNSQIQRLQQR